MNKTKNTSEILESEIDFILLIRKLWENRFLIIKMLIIGITIGLLVAVLIPSRYTASSTIIPQVSDPKSKLAGLSGLTGVAAMAGINLNTSLGSELSPKSYSNIISSEPFQLELMATPLNFENQDQKISLFDYYTKIKTEPFILKYTIGLPSMIIKAMKGDPKIKSANTKSGLLYIPTEQQIQVQRIILDNVNVTINDVDGSVTLSCTLPEAIAAAQLTLKAQELLQNYITKFKVEKARVDQEFIQQRYNEAKVNFQKIMQQLALFRDRNRNVSTATAKSEEEQLNAEYTLLFGVYSELAKKLEQANIEVKEETPVFTIIKPVSVPSKKSAPNRPIIVLIFGSIGIILSFIIIIGHDYFHQIKIKWER